MAQILKKFMLPVLIISIVIQILVPVGMIAYGHTSDNELQEFGKEFKIKVRISNIYEGSISYIFYDYNWYKLGYYAVLEEDSEGFADPMANVVEEKPKNNDYIRVTRENKIKLSEFSIDSDYTLWSVDEESAYLVIKVYKGNFEIVNLYMDGIPAEEWVKEKEEQEILFEEDINLFE